MIQSLWSGYGKIVRYALDDSEWDSVVIKQVRWPAHRKSSRQNEADLSHQRKVRSYQVEMAWYGKWSEATNEQCRVPRCLALATYGDEVWMVLEDLDTQGFPLRKNACSTPEVKACLTWLAHFHAVFLGERPQDLWKTGTYWHLATRPYELTKMNDEPLRKVAFALDQKLSQSSFQTFVHGDAKLANFCFSRDGKQVAAVDFQYTGGGVGIKDVAYLIDSAYSEEAAERMEKELLDFYFAQLRKALERTGKMIDFVALESDWRSLYPVAWTDFFRFLKGWSPGRWNPQGYSERLAKIVMEQCR